jgi:hypothetical protein
VTETVSRATNRVIADSEGHGAFAAEAVELAPGHAPGGTMWAAPLGARNVMLVRFPPDFVSDFHLSRLGAWLFVLSGRFELELASGARREFGPGEIVRFEDDRGDGHRTRTLGGEVVAVIAQTLPGRTDGDPPQISTAHL